MKELAACLDYDCRAMGADDMMNPGKEIFTLWLSSSRAEGTYHGSLREAIAGKGQKMSKVKSASGDPGIAYTVTEKSARTIAWLKEKGIYDSLVKSAEELKRAYDKKHPDEKPLDLSALP
jgi:hypothetical protein